MYSMKDIWLLVMGLILLPIFLPAGLVIIGLVIYRDYTKKYVKREGYEKEEFGTDELEQGV